MAESLRGKLRVLENDCRRQVFDAICETETAAQREVQQANRLCLSLARCLPAAQTPDLIRVKNEAVLRLWAQAKAKVREVLLTYAGIKKELLEDLPQGEVLRAPLLEQFRPALFHLPVLPVAVTLARCSRFYELYSEVQTAKVAAKSLFLNNDSMDVYVLLEMCGRLSESPLEVAYVLQPKWGICLQTSEVVTTELYLAKALVHQALNLAPIDVPDIDLREELSAFADSCYDKDKEQTGKQAGYWLQMHRKMLKAMDDEYDDLKIAYCEALRLIKAYDKAIALAREVLEKLEAEDLEDECQWNEEGRAAAMRELAWIYTDLNEPLTAAKWYSRILELEVEEDWETVTIDTVRLELSSTLVQLCKFEEAEAALAPLMKASPQPDGLCSVCGSLYFAWEKFAQSEHWLAQGLSQRPKDPLPLLLTFVRLCIKLDRLQEAESYLSRCLRLRAQPIERVQIMQLMSSYCLQQQQFSKARSWLLQSSTLLKCTPNDSLLATNLLCFGELEIEEGNYEGGISTLKSALKSAPTARQKMEIVCKLSEAQVQQGDLKGAEATLEAAEKQTTAMCAMHGKVCLAKQEWTQAREWLERAVTVQERGPPPTRETARTYSALGHLELATGRYSEAYERFVQAVNLLGTCVSAAEAYSGLAELHARSEDWESAKAALERGQKSLQKVPNHPLVARMQSQLLAIQASQ